ncbi:MAG: hypothetical protein COB59_00815 [Rhodospirillaceae bacterium]|nr:MAG: hypothetical protein COB59_00815 [Rhodospirillaceae bacterium]
MNIQHLGNDLIFTRIFKNICQDRSRHDKSHNAVAQFALFAMFIQTLIPLSAAVSFSADAQTRNGQSLPSFYLVICTAYGTQTLDTTADRPLDGDTSAVMPWDCPVCQVQTNVQGPVPNAPDLAFALRSLPRECATPTESRRVTGLWTMGPGQPRAPPYA